MGRRYPDWERGSWSKSMSTGELALPFVCGEVSWTRGRCPPYLATRATERAGPKLMRTRELAFPLTSYSTWERPAPTLVSTGELTLVV